MQSYKSHLSLLQVTGSCPRLAQIKPPQLLLDFLVDQVETQTSILGGKPRKADLQELLRRIIRKAKPCYSSIVVAMLYLDRLWRKLAAQQLRHPGRTSVFGQTGVPEVLAAFILADKYVYDIALANCEWSKVSGTQTLAQVNTYEREFFGLIDYNIQFSEQAFMEFVSFLDVSLTIRHHKLQATADFPLTYSDLCQAAEKDVNAMTGIETTTTTRTTTTTTTTTSVVTAANCANAVAKPVRPSEAGLVSLRAMMICCFTYCAVMLTVTAAMQGMKATVEVKRQLLPLTSSNSAPASTGGVSGKPFKHNTISRSESWNGCSSSALPRPTARKYSDAMMEDSNPWFLSATSGRVRS